MVKPFLSLRMMKKVISPENIVLTMKRVHVFISGRVQGVFFREYTRRKAEELGVKGWVRNLPDGRVEAVFEGEDKAVDEMVRWCWKGSPYSKVTNVEAIEEEYRGEFGRFEIRW